MSNHKLMNPSTNLSWILIKKFGRTKSNVLSLAYIDSKLIRVSWVTFLGNVKFSSNNNFPFTQHLLCMREGVLTPLNQNKLLKFKNFFGSTPFLLFCTIYYLETSNNICTLLTLSLLSPKFKRVSLNETPEFPFWGLNIL